MNTAPSTERGRLWKPRRKSALWAAPSVPVGIGGPQGNVQFPVFPLQGTTPSLWYIADRGVQYQLPGGNSVTTWLDQSGSANANLTAGGGPQITASNASYGGQPTIATSSASLSYTGAFSVAQPFTVFLACNFTTTTGERMVIGDDAFAKWAIYSNGASPNKWAIAPGTGADFVSSLTVDANPHAVCGVFNGASSGLYIDASATNLVTATGGTLAMTTITLGGITSFFFVGAYMEVIALNFAASSGQRSTIFSYFGAKAGTTWS